MSARAAVLLVLLAAAGLAAADGPFDFLPELEATVKANGASEKWAGRCFQSSSATLMLGTSAGQLTIVAEDPRDSLCSDLYFIASAERFEVREIFFHGEHQIKLDWRPDELQDVKVNGVSIFHLEDGVLGSLIDAWDTWKFFANDMKDIKAFLQDRMNITLETRKAGNLPIRAEDVKSGDTFFLTELSSTRAGADTMVMYGTGGRAGHVAVALWFPDGLFVCESVTYVKVPNGTVGITRSPFAPWVQAAYNGGWLVNWVRLSDKAQAAFNVDAATKFFWDNYGFPYGFKNFLYSWLDTANDNFPPPLTTQGVAALSPIADKVKPADFSLVIGDGLNMRLGTSGLGASDLFQLMDKRNLTLGDVFAMPEQDAWRYDNQRQMVCSVFVMSVMKAAGVFGSLDIQTSEFTPRDAYAVDIWQKTAAWQPSYCERNEPWCQWVGQYYLPLTAEFSTIAPFAHMMERCGNSPPPEYTRRPANC